ncbi:GntP family permease [Streptococcus agalactiae]|uniref:GntP family permease n=1 Tax=Streptococcus agalactiae TaxID=1311 RepID=UPI000301650E|nr:GntP family permease [Streptococcus agalactiae]EPT47246.1 gluconate:proton symporter [Streptococcus agalactiae FSL S3-170]
MEATFTTTGALIGLALAILLIIKKVHPAYSLILGALVGGLIGGGDLVTIVNTMVLGAQGMMSSILRILTSGILAGALIKTGSAEKIAESIIKKLGQQRAIATMIICAVGVFIDIAVITVAPIALAIGKKANLSKSSILLAMIGGGKAGNIISPNPNTIAASEAFKVDLTSLMVQNIIPAIAALVVTIILAKIVSKKNNDISYDSEEQVGSDLPAFLPAISGPLVVICLLALRPLFGITIDPLIALPLGGLISILATGYLKETVPFVEYGLSKVVGVSILLIGTGTLSGIIKASNLQFDMIHLLEFLNMPTFILAPLSGIFMGAATASTTSGTTIASQTFAETLIKSGVPAVSGAAMIHAGATVLDSLPHGSFFHATGGAVNMAIKDRMKLISYEALIGLTSTIVAVVYYCFFG